METAATFGQFPDNLRFSGALLVTHFIDVRKLSYLKHKFASIDTKFNECYVVCDKNKLLVKKTVQSLLRICTSPSRGGACVCTHVAASLRIPYCAGRCLRE